MWYPTRNTKRNAQKGGETGMGDTFEKLIRANFRFGRMCFCAGPPPEKTFTKRKEQ